LVIPLTVIDGVIVCVDGATISETEADEAEEDDDDDTADDDFKSGAVTEVVVDACLESVVSTSIAVLTCATAAAAGMLPSQMCLSPAISVVLAKSGRTRFRCANCGIGKYSLASVNRE
jgi:hypothetical protein